MLRRRLLASSALLGAFPPVSAHAGPRSLQPWLEATGQPPAPIANRQVYLFFTSSEAAMVEAIADRLIPEDALGIGGRQAGCAVFIDRQLAGSYGKGSMLYLAGPAAQGTPTQGPQGVDPPATRYRNGLAALTHYCATQTGGTAFQDLAPGAQDQLLSKLETGQIDLGEVSSPVFFNMVLTNVREGYFADPVYGGNKDMAGWKMIGFPGAQYDFRPYLNRLGEKLDIPSVSLFASQGSRL